MFHVVIPARHGSVRFPGKPLAPLLGRPMLQWVHERASASRAASVTIATDDARIAAAAQGFGAAVRMTRADHASGTDRIAEVAALERWDDAAIVVNVQGDEPGIPPAVIDQVAQLLGVHADADIATLATPVTGLEQFLDPNAVKVVADLEGRALYFSRAPIPWSRDGAAAGLASQQRWQGARRHLGIYAYRVGALRRLAQLPPAALEETEKLEQLRALANGLRIRVADAIEVPGPDVNTPEDLERAAQRLAATATR
ncbi:MAG: 3-deoxy-manno-octulosonate cytidylyltransferase [Steroidobacteraceae bacterium]